MRLEHGFVEHDSETGVAEFDEGVGSFRAGLSSSAGSLDGLSQISSSLRAPIRLESVRCEPRQEWKDNREQERGVKEGKRNARAKAPSRRRVAAYFYSLAAGDREAASVPSAGSSGSNPRHLLALRVSTELMRLDALRMAVQRERLHGAKPCSDCTALISMRSGCARELVMRKTRDAFHQLGSHQNRRRRHAKPRAGAYRDRWSASR